MTTGRKSSQQLSMFEQLFADMVQKLERIEQQGNPILLATENCIVVCKNAMQELRQQLTLFSFTSTEDEIHFFKTIKPRFYSRLIYYLNVFNIETRRPNGAQKAEEKFLRRELQKLTHFFENNLEFYQYYRTGATYLDEKYYLRGATDLYLTLDPHYFNTDPSFSTSHDYKVARLLANESLRSYLQQAIDHTLQQHQIAPQNAAKPVLTWTGSKTALIELIYALQSTGVFNNGAADVKLIASYVQEVFHVELGNYYRTFQEIRIRKGSRTQFLEQLTKQVTRRMDETDELIR